MMSRVEVAVACPGRPRTRSITGLRVRWTLVWPSDAHIGPTASASAVAAAVLALFPVQDPVLGEERYIGGDVSAGGGVVGPGQQLEDVEPIVGREGHGEGLPSGRNQLPMRWTRSAGKTLLGISPWTALGGIEV